MKTVKVRIAVAVDPTGSWNACGCNVISDFEKMALACDVLDSGEARYWLEAELAIPQISTIQAAVVDAP